MEEGRSVEKITVGPPYAPSPELLRCRLCGLSLRRPTTLACGHSFCHRCLIAAVVQKFEEAAEGRMLSLIPVCPQCLSIVWRYSLRHTVRSPPSGKTSSSPPSSPNTPRKDTRKVLR